MNAADEPLDQLEVEELNKLGEMFDLFWFDGSEPIENNADSSKFWFKFEKGFTSINPERCFPLKISLRQGKMHEIITQSNETKSFVPKRVLEQEFDIIGLADKIRDPETLDDSDLDILLPGDTADQSCNSSDSPSDLLETTLVIAKNSLHLAGTDKYHKLHTSITDCRVLDRPGSQDDTILLTLADNRVYSLLFDEDLEPRVLQWWSLNDVFKGDGWELIVHQSKKHFVTVQKSSGTMMFFKMINDYHFELINNMHIDNGLIFTSEFFQNGSDYHVMLFVAVLRLSRMIFLVVEFDFDHEEKKIVHPLTLLASNKIEKCIPLNQTHMLLFAKDTIQLVSANQILSGEPSFKTFERSVFGDIIENYIVDSNLLEKIRTGFEEFSSYKHCSIFTTSNGALCCLLANDQTEVKFLGLTRFKGIRNVTLANNKNTGDLHYKVIITSFGRTFELLLDLSNIQEISKDYKIPSLSNIISRRTIDAAHVDGETLMCIRSLNNDRDDETQLWMTSASSLSKIETKRSIQNTSTLFASRKFQIFNSIHVIDCKTLSSRLKIKLFGETSISSSFLVIGTDSNSQSKAYLLNISNALEEPECHELNDILKYPISNTLLYFITEANIIQIVDENVYVCSLEDGQKPWAYSPGWKIDGARHLGDQVVLWNVECNTIVYCRDVNARKRDDFILFEGPNDDWCPKNDLRSVEFLSESEEESALFCVTSLKVHKYRCKSIAPGVKPEKVLDAEDFNSLTSIKNHLVACSRNLSMYGTTTNEECFKAQAKAHGVLEIRPYDEEHFIAFGPFEVVLFDINTWEQIVIGVSGCKKTNPILELRIVSGLIFVLFGDGLQVVKPTYRTRTPMNIILKSTRSKNKKFVFLRKINRMLVLNMEKKLLDCIKLENGKILSLDVTCLKEFENIYDVCKLESKSRGINLVICGTRKVRSKDHTEKQLLLKLIGIVPKPGKLSVRSIHTFFTNDEVTSLKAINEFEFYAKSDKTLTMFRIESDHLEKRIQYSTTSQILGYDVTEKVVALITTQSGLEGQLLAADGTWMQFQEKNMVTKNRYTKIKIINNKELVLSSETIGNEKYSNELLLYEVGSSINIPIKRFGSALLTHPVRDIEYCSNDGKLYLLHSDGSISVLRRCSSEVPIHSPESPKFRRIQTATGHWSIGVNGISAIDL